MRRLSVTALALVLSAASVPYLAGQANPPDRPSPGGPEPMKPEVTEPIKPMSVPAAVDPNVYRLGPDDIISVRVWRENDLSGQLSIRPDGKITMPLVNELKAAELTPTQLADEIARALTKFVNNPQVTVTVLSVRSKKYYVSGEVGRPGAYPLASPLKVFEALTMAGGFREFANKKKITIIRGAKRFRFNWNEVVKGKHLWQNITLENGDQVIVP